MILVFTVQVSVEVPDDTNPANVSLGDFADIIDRERSKGEVLDFETSRVERIED